ncbi:MAG: cbb3-type cytochrome c oxidase subunit I [Actinomycetota bacterium]|nr:cbb3-type cytochrome c oxidase subunit I [Actinomycetota bacterium]
MTATLDHTAAPPDATAPGLIRRLNVVTGIVVGVLLAVASHYLAAWLLPDPADGSHKNDAVALISMAGWAIGFLVGVGAFIGPFRWLLGHDLTHEDEEYLAGKDAGTWRYFKFTTDHKVVGIQYLVTTMVLLGVGGTLAMLIRTNLINPGQTFVGPLQYNSLVGLHGIIMIIATIVMVSGPFGNFIVPIMIGARDMAFPRLNALSFWLLFAAVPVLLSAFVLGGIPTGWSAYEPLADQAPLGMDAFLVTIIIFAVSTGVAGMNITTTVVKMRARGMTWNRTPIFVFGTTTSVALGLVAFPMFMVAMVLMAMDRSMGATFYVASEGGSAWLYSNLFWLMGHPEVYVILLPPFIALLEMTPVFTRRPLFSFRAAVLGIFGIVGLSLFVWAHHMYMSGWAPVLAGPFMVTTELISIPTGLLFLVLLGTLWRGRVWLRLPVMAVYAVLFNFTIGGITGIYLSDVPVDQAMHGSMFVTAHFHYTLMGAGLTGALGALAFWFPKMTGRMLDERWGAIGFWMAQLGFQVTFMGMFAVGMAGQPRRVSDPSTMFHVGNLVSTMGAYTIGLGMLVFLYAIVHSWRHGALSGANPWGSRTLEWQVPTPVPLENFTVLPVVTSDFYGYGEDTDPEPPGGSRSEFELAGPAGGPTAGSLGGGHDGTT